MLNVFFAYSHRDEDLRDELDVHLAQLKRSKIIGTFHDRKIGAGKELDKGISEFLEPADIILLLISPYFLASDYCYEIELKRAMEKHEAGEARVIPVILRPCDWKSAPFGKLLAVPRDGKPITSHKDPHEGFLEVTMAIRAAADELRGETRGTTDRRSGSMAPTPSTKSEAKPKGAAPRLKRTITDLERDQYLATTFDEISNFFKNSLEALKANNAQLQTAFHALGRQHFSATAYVDGKLAGRCGIWVPREGFHQRAIAYSQGEGGGTSWNEMLHVADDGISPYLTATGMLGRPGEAGKMSAGGAASYFWEHFLNTLRN
ncbi:MAG: toll/interleukin-1 receptor domain-containing protein [Planctomycetes bacterium]|nr:toll/interleukin-1 receptor domain-containing protein [Planctomycetota bacterium]